MALISSEKLKREINKLVEYNIKWTLNTNINVISIEDIFKIINKLESEEV